MEIIETLKLHGQQFDLTNVTAHSITVKGDDAGSKKNKKHQLVLTNSTIAGDVICERGKNYELVLKGKTTIGDKIMEFKRDIK